LFSFFCTYFYVVTRSARHESLRASWLAGIRPIARIFTLLLAVHAMNRFALHGWRAFALFKATIMPSRLQAAGLHYHRFEHCSLLITHYKRFGGIILINFILLPINIVENVSINSLRM
jgi:hypothetical protein